MTEVEAKYSFETLSVLVVDDQPFMRQLLTEVLRALGVGDVILAANARAGFEMLDRSLVDVVMVDWQMEPLDGIELVRMIRQDRNSPNPYVPIIMMSGHSEAWRVARARDSGANAYLAKPVSAKAIYSRLISIIEDPRPFVRVGSYLGPDRRWKDDTLPKGVAADRRGGGDDGF